MRGFSLIEILVAMSVSIILMLAVSYVLTAQTDYVDAVELSLRQKNRATAILNRMELDIQGMQRGKHKTTSDKSYLDFEGDHQGIYDELRFSTTTPWRKHSKEGYLFPTSGIRYVLAAQPRENKEDDETEYTGVLYRIFSPYGHLEKMSDADPSWISALPEYPDELDDYDVTADPEDAKRFYMSDEVAALGFWYFDGSRWTSNPPAKIEIVRIRLVLSDRFVDSSYNVFVRDVKVWNSE